MKWRRLSFWHAIVAISRNAAEWVADPRQPNSNEQVLRSRLGLFYEYRYTPKGWFIRRITNDWWGY